MWSEMRWERILITSCAIRRTQTGLWSLDLTPYLCRQAKWRERNGGTSSHTRQLHTMCSLVNQHLMNSAQRQLARRPGGTAAQAGDLCAHTEAAPSAASEALSAQQSISSDKVPLWQSKCTLYSGVCSADSRGWQLAHLMCASPVLIPPVVRWQGPACDLDQGLDCRLLRKSGEFSMERASIELITGNYSLRAMQKKRVHPQQITFILYKMSKWADKRRLWGVPAVYFLLFWI